jgi:hypothetical protein
MVSTAVSHYTNFERFWLKNRKAAELQLDVIIQVKLKNLHWWVILDADVEWTWTITR